MQRNVFAKENIYIYIYIYTPSVTPVLLEMNITETMFFLPSLSLHHSGLTTFELQLYLWMVSRCLPWIMDGTHHPPPPTPLSVPLARITIGHFTRCLMQDNVKFEDVTSSARPNNYKRIDIAIAEARSASINIEHFHCLSCPKNGRIGSTSTHEANWFVKNNTIEQS